MAIQKGTGFTNINRILQANKGSKLGQTVAGGITGQVQKVQSGVAGAQQSFDEEAQKNRLDTDEAKAKREQVLGRFNEANYAPDMSKFNVSSGVQQGFDQNKAKIEQDKAAKQAEITQMGAGIQTQKQGVDDLYAKYLEAKRIQDSGYGKKDLRSIPFRQATTRAWNAYNAANSAYSQAQTKYGQEQTGLGAFDTQMATAQSNYDKQKQAETEAFQKAERAKLVAANLPSEQEIQDFTKYRTGTYTGPSQLAEAGALTSQAQQAESLGGLARSAGGRQELLRQFVGGRDYTSGQRRLDETILGQDQSANLGAAARQTRGAVEGVQEANRMAANKAGEYVNRAKEFGEETRGIIGQTKTPISGGLEARIAEAQKAEESRLSNLKAIQDLMLGQGEDYAGLDKLTRLGLGLDQAQKQGYLKDQDVNFLLGQNGKTGLIQRGLNLGLDVNQLLNERMKDVAAQNLNRTGVASDEDVARLNALDRLSGKVGTDLEFQNGRGKYQAGSTNFDLKSLEDYITRAEQQKAASDAKYASDLATQKGSYLDNALAYGAAGLGNLVGTNTGQIGLGAGYLASQAAAQAAAHAAATSAAYGATSGGLASAASGLAPGLGATAEYGAMAIPGAEAASAQIAGNLASSGALTGAEAGAAAGAEGAGLAAGAEGGLAEMGAGPIALAAMLGYDTLTGGRGTADTANFVGNAGINAGGAVKEGGVNILKGLLGLNVGGKSIGDSDAGRQINKVLDYTSKTTDSALGGTSNHLNDWTGSLGDLTSQSLNDITHGNVSNLVKNILNVSGAKNMERTIGDVLRETGLSGVSNSLKSGLKSITGGGIKISDEDLKTDIDYSPRDVQAFMDRIKPASYNYKEEVKNDPRASKDRQLGVMAQDLEKSKLGKEAVHNTDVGKVVDYKDLEPKMLASLAALNQRMKKLEGKE